MPQAPPILHEQRRLAAARALRMIGTPAEDRFDRLTRLAKKFFKVDMALVDIVADKLVWIKSAQGLDAVGPPRATSYCQYTIQREELCLIQDARKDPRVRDLGSPYRFYAGVPLYYDGEPVGVFCIADHKPRTLSDEEMQELFTLAELAERELQVAALSQAQIEYATEADELEAKAMIDPLTRAWTRAAIDEIAARELQRGMHMQTPTGLLMVDVDHFKKVNDTIGHQGGDEVLRVVPARLRGAVRIQDAVGRYGGEEFLIVLPNCGDDELGAVAERVRLRVQEQSVWFEDKELQITVSIGGTVSRDGGHFVGLLVKAADDALYKAKREGRNRVCTRRITTSLAARAAIRPK